MSLSLLFVNYPAWLKPQIIPSLPFRWYGLMYVVAFGVAYILFLRALKESKTVSIARKDVDTLFFYGIIGLIVCARLFYVFVYDFKSYASAPLSIIWPFEDGQFVGIRGISFHGGVIGALLGVILFCRKRKINVMSVTDLCVYAIPFGYTFGRLGNFINAELYGKVALGGFSMLFPTAELLPTSEEWVRTLATNLGIDATGLYVNLPRFPSQLLEALFEGLVLGLFLWFIIRRIAKFPGYGTSYYLMGYGFVRFFIEYLREPDNQLGYIIKLGPGADNPRVYTSLLNFSMGQLLCFIMFAIGLGLFFVCKELHKRRGLRKLALNR